MTVRAIIQARMGSTRLPGKTLMDVEGEPLLERVINTANKLPIINSLTVATASDNRFPQKNHTFLR
jgi:spore coat polysaccharide biosynthesis protein SpsF (cytidylyltransferase family)